jgi:hypothetical protein
MQELVSIAGFVLQVFRPFVNISLISTFFYNLLYNNVQISGEKT